MTLQRTLTIISALLLLYCAFTLLITLLSATLNGINKDPFFLTYLGLLLLALSVTFVTGYRQTFRQRPKLVIIALCLIIISQCLGFFLLQHALNDPLTIVMNKVINEGVREGLANGTIPKDHGLEEHITDTDVTWVATLKSIGFYLLLFAIPFYTNFRRVTLPS